MPNTTISPDMNLPVPVVGTDPGPDWATNLNACLLIIDSHNHSNGQGVQISPSGMDINTDLPMNGNNLTTARSVRFSPQNSPLAAGTDIGCLYESGVDLYFNDGSGNQIRITQSGSVTGSSGTITGLPSGTASVAFAGATYTFQSATSTPATINVGPVVIGRASASSKTVTLTPTSGQPTNYTLSFPSAVPAANQILVSDGSGNLTWLGAFTSTGSFTGTFGGVSGTVTATFYYTISNNIVTLTASSLSISMTKSGNGSITISGSPAAILPSSATLYTTLNVSANGGASYLPALCSITSTGIEFWRDSGQDDFTNLASVIFQGAAFTYLLR